MTPIDPAQLKAHLPHTWTPFFARHGNFTPVQQQAIPPILDGQNALVTSATASGKTEAVIAPLLERHVLGENCGPGDQDGLCILYICPTRALVRDLYERLAPPLQELGVALAMKSGDTGPVSIQSPPTVLITTPESTDSLLTRAPRLLASVQAIVLDEIHLFDDGPRGDHLRCLLRRIERIRAYRQQEPAAEGRAPTPLQRVALSATVPDPSGVAVRYLTDTDGLDEAAASPLAPPPSPAIVQVAGSRRLLAEIVPMLGLDDLVMGLAMRAAHKSLVFCNTRNEVEQVAAYLRAHLPYDAAIFVHYSNLDPALRRDVESGFAEAGVAICVSSSTLELGIDIGSIDDVVLVGPPPTVISFLQRIGRGGRRTGTTRVLCLPRSPLEEIRFRALIDLAQTGSLHPQMAVAECGEELTTVHSSQLTPHPSPLAPAYRFRPSVLVQQIFSMLKQSPTGGIRLADLRRVAPDEVADKVLHRVLSHLAAHDYLRPGRPGEWRPGPALDDLVDAHEIYSNIGGEPLAATVVDAYTGRTIAQTTRIRLQGDTLLMGGRVMEVMWRDRYRFGVRQGPQRAAEEEMRFHTAPFAVSLEVGQAVAAYLGLPRGQLPLLLEADGVWLFHFWGDIYGELLAAVLQFYLAGEEEIALVRAWNEHCLHLPIPLARLPAWDAGLARQQLHRLAPEVEHFLELGRFHSLLPPDVAYEAAVRQCDLSCFEALYRAATLMAPSAGLRTRLRQLL